MKVLETFEVQRRILDRIVCSPVLSETTEKMNGTLLIAAPALSSRRRLGTPRPYRFTVRIP
jgi:hypothetical protein